MGTFIFSIIGTQDMSIWSKKVRQFLGKLAQNLQKWGQNILFWKPKLVSMELFYNISWVAC